MRRAFAASCLVLVLASCTESDTPSEITGTVVEVDSTGLTEVDSIVVSSDGDRFTILLDENTELDFPPAHLNEHRISGDPVRVEVEESDGTLVATSIGDG
jgi:hypothetical protein